ncbi:polysaccharide deacetylase family protein [Putridiphycobacter roseus]|uniref:Polysaccharide deacetylase family protein n=1 Tax=Putridiphycobacter roseus TaxID=2219161 RepID=A0A2W1N0U8_9FLAO|nr:polysaccharide deacetylase family protein [Putridiphycobacter roseus]PZE17160.1 polysaccharide deacetylase family protein [Putridiphycobacter roseus]
MRIFKYPKWLRRLYPDSIWGIFTSNPILYLTFDDGPCPEITDWILQELRQYNAKATFFCLGKNSKNYPLLMSKIIADGHLVGNHSMRHLNGRKSGTKAFLADVEEAARYTSTTLFRPPYGKLKFKQHNLLKKAGYQTIFWSYLSYDFDLKIPVEKLVEQAKKKIKAGDIIVLHDSEKAFVNMRVLLPEILTYFSEKGFQFKAIPR